MTFTDFTEEHVIRAAKVLFYDTYQGKPHWGDEDAEGIQMRMLREMYINKARRVLTIALSKEVLAKTYDSSD